MRSPYLCSPQLRPIRTSKLNSLPSVHSSPIYPVFFGGSITIPHLGVGLALEMLSALIPTRYSYPAMPHQLAEQQAHQGSVLPGPLVLRKAPLKNQTLALDRDRTVLRIIDQLLLVVWTISSPRNAGVDVLAAALRLCSLRNKSLRDLRFNRSLPSVLSTTIVRKITMDFTDFSRISLSFPRWVTDPLLLAENAIRFTF